MGGLRMGWLNAVVVAGVLLGACAPSSAPPTSPTPSTSTASRVKPTDTPPAPTSTLTPVPLPALSIELGATGSSDGLSLDHGGDVDSSAETKAGIETRATGNGTALPGGDGNTTPDSYLQFNVADAQILNGQPTAHVEIQVDYIDTGKDTFSLQYDAQSGAFAGGGTVAKTATGSLKTASFNLCDAKFANRDNGADFRLSDNGDGPEFIHAVRVVGLPSGVQTLSVDAFGADPTDANPDSDAVQAALNATCSGDTVMFTSGQSDAGYTGYLIDKTLFLTGLAAKHDLTFTSSDPRNHALLKATADLKGFVVRLFARSSVTDGGKVDNIDFGYIDVDGGRDVRVCPGPNQVEDGVDDNWGSWLPECGVAGDPWCSAGTIAMGGAMDQADPAQDFNAHPSDWTTGVVVHDLVDRNTECASALSFEGAAGAIHDVTIDTAGDHVHATGCAFTDNDGDRFGWSDGITLFGPSQTVENNTIVDPSDVGIVYFGGKNTTIRNNQLEITPGNYGAFAGIALHPWVFGDASGTQITGNQVVSQGDSKCGGLHVGINIGAQMWGGACVSSSTAAMVGDSRPCSNHPDVSAVGPCQGGACQLWAYVPAGANLTMQGNQVTGAQINYLVEGLDAVGSFVDQGNLSQAPQLTDWDAARAGCSGVTWGALDKVAHDPALPGYTDVLIHCER